MSYNLFLDDERVVSDVHWVELPLVEWAIVRSYAEFVAMVSERGIPNRVSFDHDLVEEHYLHGAQTGFRSFDYDACLTKTGFHCAVWLGRLCEEKQVPFPEYYVHSMNSVGRLNIENYISGLSIR
jgi:hypothetical protein